MFNKKIFTKAILLLSFISLFSDIASEMLYPVMPVYLKSIGFSVLLIGILEGLAECVAGLSKGYFGNLSDKMGRRVPFIKWGYLFNALSKPMLAIFINPLWIFFARTLDRFGKGIRTAARDALLSQETTKENKGKVFGFHRSMDTVGAAIGPVLSLIYLYYHPGQYRWLFVIAFLPGLLVVALSGFLKEKKIEAENTNRKPVHFLTYLKYWKKSPPAFKKLVPALLTFTLFNSSDAFLLLALKYKGFTDLQMIGFYISYNLLYALLSYPLGVIADKIGLKKVLVSGLAIFAFVYFLFGWASSVWQFVVLFLFYSIYAASTEGISKAWITNVSKEEETATAIGFFTSFNSIITFISSALGGLIWVCYGPKVMFMFSGIGVALVVVYLTLPYLSERVVKKANGNS
ncbi:MAG: MFS transporter [Bacteroidota bacterium]|nr:MFS transporter [Bacteroidota bacterium]